MDIRNEFSVPNIGQLGNDDFYNGTLRRHFDDVINVQKRFLVEQGRKIKLMMSLNDICDQQ